MLIARRQIARWRARVELWLEGERDQLILWLPVMLGAGIAAWFALPTPRLWIAAILAAVALGAGALALGGSGRALRVVAIGAGAFALGVALIWVRAERVAAPRLAAPAIVHFTARVARVEALPPRGQVRLWLAPVAVVDARRLRTLPPLVRVTLAVRDAPAGLGEGAVIALGARLVPPSPPPLPGGYDFARAAWFDGMGATGRGFAPVRLISPGATGDGVRARLSSLIEARVPGSGGGIAAALASGDEGAIADADADAIRRSGLAHLLSVSGLHISAVVAATMWIVLRLLALSPWLALRLPLPLVAAGAGAGTAIGYTLLTGAQVPTVRSCVAALMVLLAMAMGRRAMTLRLVAAGAVVVVAFWPEAVMGASFQLSFAAVTVIIALHEAPVVRGWFAPREESRARRLARGMASLLLTGAAVEAALAPIGLFHFHKAGIYGAVANLAAIPLTTFVIMPAEAGALLLDPLGLAPPLWWITARSLDLLLAIAHVASRAPGSVAALPVMPWGAFAAMVAGGLWLLLWRTRARFYGVAPLVAGALWAVLTPAPDLLVSGDGRHVAIRAAGGALALLRERTGARMRAILAENAGIEGEPLVFDDLPGARCSADLCVADMPARARKWRVVATRSSYWVDRDALNALCAAADIVVSDRRLPRGCLPRWLRLDVSTLRATGGVAVTLASGHVRTVLAPVDLHPWRIAPEIPGRALSRSDAAAPRAGPARAPAWDDNAVDHKRGSPDQAEPSPPRAGNI